MYKVDGAAAPLPSTESCASCGTVCVGRISAPVMSNAASPS